jgi:hypothetical protein
VARERTKTNKEEEEKEDIPPPAYSKGNDMEGTTCKCQVCLEGSGRKSSFVTEDKNCRKHFSNGDRANSTDEVENRSSRIEYDRCSSQRPRERERRYSDREKDSVSTEKKVWRMFGIKVLETRTAIRSSIG